MARFHFPASKMAKKIIIIIKDNETKGQMAIRTKHKSWSVGQTDKITDRMIQKINVKPIVVHPIILSLTKNSFARSQPGSTKATTKEESSLYKTR